MKKHGDRPPLQPPNQSKMFTVPQADDLIKKSRELLSTSNTLLDEARKVAKRSGLSVDSSILDASYQSTFLPSFLSNADNAGNGSNNVDNQGQDAKGDGILKAFPTVLSTTGGHSNIDHIIQFTGNYKKDKISEYKRKLKRRIRSMQPEQKGTDRWDQPRIAGSRRRRIVREVDLPCAPPEPPPSGYVIFIAQMTTKIRHDKPNVHHNQIKVVKEISKIWKFGMSDTDRKYYNDFCKETREEYEKQHAEYKATGTFKPSKAFEKLHGDGPWVRITFHEKNALEREISSYESVKFPPRPLDMDKPDWVKKIEKARGREMERKKAREERAKKQRETELRELEDANNKKVKRLKTIL
jgi:hypothetical protein